MNSIDIAEGRAKTRQMLCKGKLINTLACFIYLHDECKY